MENHFLSFAQFPAYEVDSYHINLILGEFTK
jgi:hypothetical protein